MSNLMPDRYRQVAVAEVSFPLTETALRRHLIGREAYRRTQFIVVRSGAETAVVGVSKRSEEPLFSPITVVELVAEPSECALVRDPEIDTGVPSQLAAAARRHAPDKRCVIVYGRYEHVSFIVDPRPVSLVVRDVVPPSPAKLVDQAQRVLDISEDLPPVMLVPDVVDLSDLVADAGEYLLPCVGGGVDVAGARVSYLDQRPERKQWTLIGCTRSQQIHRWVYGEPAPGEDFCPRHRAPGATPVLTRCCLLEEGLEVGDFTVCVPWGASLSTVKAGLEAAIGLNAADSVQQSAAVLTEGPGQSTSAQATSTETALP